MCLPQNLFSAVIQKTPTGKNLIGFFVEGTRAMLTSRGGPRKKHVIPAALCQNFIHTKANLM